LRKIYRKCHKYKKTGIILTDIIPEDRLHYGNLDETNRKKLTNLIHVEDKINAGVGQGAVKFAVKVHNDAVKCTRNDCLHNIPANGTIF